MSSLNTKKRRLNYDIWSTSLLCLVPLDILTDVIYFVGPSKDLVHLQLTCHFFYDSIEISDYWKSLIEIELSGVEHCFMSEKLLCSKPAKKYFDMRKLARSFKASNHNIYDIRSTSVDDEVLYLNIRILPTRRIPIYIELCIDENSDNLSLALVDFDGSGISSVTFSPDTGSVIKENRRIDETAQIDGYYAPLLNPIHGSFVGKAGVLIENGKIAFYREFRGIWDSTGFCCDISALPAGKITPCVAFRDVGKYSVTVSNISVNYPFQVESAKNVVWKPIVWNQV
jgi:hypothetical protein